MSQVVAMIPAHNEAAGIIDAIAGLTVQDRRPDRIVVVADNCTDDTARLAREAGAEVFERRATRPRRPGRSTRPSPRSFPTSTATTWY